MHFKDLRKEIRSFWKTELNGRNIKIKEEPEDNILALNYGEKKWRNKNRFFFKGGCKKCGKYYHRVSDCCGKKNENRN